MHYVYILFSENDNGLYIGKTDNLERRICEHKRGKVTSTKKRLPIKLIFYEAFLNREDAGAREKYLKSGFGRQQISQILKNLFLNLNINKP